jgi:hypothetical protein
LIFLIMPDKKQTLSESERLELIIHAIKYCKLVKVCGMPKTCYSKALREPIFFLWENYRKGRKYWVTDFVSDLSVAERDNGRSVIYDHAVPFNLVGDMLMSLDSPTKESVSRILNEFVVSVLITSKENDELNNLGLKSKMPKDWDGKNVLARYEAAKINVTINNYQRD